MPHPWIRTNILLVLCSAMFTVLGLTGILLYHYTGEQQQQQQAERYGQALAQSVARLAIEPTMAQDMISLQAILQASASQPGILGATIHNVEQLLLVQSGETAPVNTPHIYPSFSAPITLNEHIAGYLTITLNLQDRNQTHTLFLWLWLLMVGGSIATLWLVRSFIHKPSTPTNESEVEIISTTTGDNLNAVVIELSLLNITQLHAQLSQEIFNERLGQLDQQLKGVLTLYAGFKHQFAHNRLSLRVEGDSRSNACFHALCICQLILRLNARSLDPKFKIAAVVTPIKTWKNSDALLQGYLTGARPEQKSPAIWVDPQLHDAQLQQKVTLDSDNQLHTIHSPYCDLLQRQEQQLANLMNTP